MQKKFWFTLVEVMVSITIFSLVVLVWFQALSAFWIERIKLVEDSNVHKQLFFETQKLFSMVKASWNIDYEEYFNRTNIWKAQYNKHYFIRSWFWNFWWDNLNVWSSNYWNTLYNCSNISWSAWCASWNQQRFLQYERQFIDIKNPDILEDDNNLWNWPSVIFWDEKELYLISNDWKKRTLFRLKTENDTYAPSSEICDISNNIYDWCIWNIEFLELEWRDFWENHIYWDNDNLEGDGIIDTWVYPRKLTWIENVVAWSTNVEYWQKLFWDDINITSFEIRLAPQKDLDLAWKTSLTSKISPYIDIKMTALPSFKKRKLLNKTPKPATLQTRINLSPEIINN